MFTSKEKQAGRMLLKMLAANQVKLPSTIDNCLGYFTGYKDSNIEIKNVDEFLDLAAKCIDYCNLLRDKETLQLLFYAVSKRFYMSNPQSFFGEESNIFKFWDVLSGDGAGIYKNNTSLQVKDMSFLFHTWLNFIKSERCKIKRSNIFIDFLKPWKKEAAPNDQVPNPKQWIAEYLRYTQEDLAKNTSIYFTRGGGLYCFLDIIKGLSLGLKDDNSPLKGVYVSPTVQYTERGERDTFYAYEYSRARRFGDIPSFQSGEISPERMLLVNHNLYEGFIKSEDLIDIVRESATTAKEKLKLHPQPVKYEERMPHILNKRDLDELAAFLPDDSQKKSFIDRVVMILDILKYNFHLSEEENIKNAAQLKHKYQGFFAQESSDKSLPEDKKLRP